MSATPEDVTKFWLEEVGPSGWYEANDKVDATISQRFGPTWDLAREGKLGGWRISPGGALAFLIVTDQFPRNMFRGKPEAFATDLRARAAADQAIARGWDLEVPEPERQFFYLPFEHSEFIADQDRAVCLMQRNMTDPGASGLLHARVHREIIRRFSRFPFRNAALGRKSSAAEQAFLDDGGYGALVREMQASETA